MGLSVLMCLFGFFCSYSSSSFTDNLVHLVLLLLREFRHLCGEIPVKISDVINSQVQLGTAREHIDAGIVKEL